MMTASVYTKILPQPTPVDAPFWEAANQDELRLQKCSDCGHVWYPPSNACSNCLSTDFTWEKMSGKGRIWSWVIFHKCYFPSFEADIPYNVVSVKLEEGPLLTSNLVNCKDDDLVCDKPVEVMFDHVTPEVTLVKFQPVEKGEQS